MELPPTRRRRRRKDDTTLIAQVYVEHWTMRTTLDRAVKAVALKEHKRLGIEMRSLHARLRRGLKTLDMNTVLTEALTSFGYKGTVLQGLALPPHREHLDHPFNQHWLKQLQSGVMPWEAEPDIFLHPQWRILVLTRFHFSAFEEKLRDSQLGRYQPRNDEYLRAVEMKLRRRQRGKSR